jgi:hypothetical protein
MGAERKYTLTKVAAGDYLLPANDAKTVWRIMVYEDGPSHGVESMAADRMFWGIWKWRGDPHCIDIAAMDRWEMVDSTYETRQQAIDAALKMGATR